MVVIVVLRPRARSRRRRPIGPLDCRRVPPEALDSQAQRPLAGSQVAILRAAPGASVDATVRRRVSTVSGQPGGTSRGARSREGRQDEQPLPGVSMRDLEPSGGLGGVLVGIVGASLGRPLDGDPVPPEHQQVEIELARPPASTRATPGESLQRLELAEERERARRRIGTGRHIHRHDRVVEIGLVGHAPRSGDVQRRDPAQADAGQTRQRVHGPGQGRRRVTDVRAETDIGAHPSFAHGRSRSSV